MPVYATRQPRRRRQLATKTILVKKATTPPVDTSPPCSTCHGIGVVTAESPAYARARVVPDAAPGTVRPCPSCTTAMSASPRPPAAKSAAWAHIEKAATELAQPGMTPEQAVARATDKRPDLVAAWRTAPPDPEAPQTSTAKAAGIDPRAALAAVVDTRAREVANADGIPLAKAYDRLLDSADGIAFRAADAALAGRTTAATELAKTSHAMRR